ncbi:MAG: RICIN domain-containing protein [Saprospiraceae bacterium]|nr:RICIN domain-containing protein [Saprospiraceae bacterium]
MFSAKRYYQIMNRNSTYSLRPYDFGKGGDENLIFKSILESGDSKLEREKSYHWQFIPVPGDLSYYYIINRKSGKYLKNGGGIYNDRAWHRPLDDQGPESTKGLYKWSITGFQGNGINYLLKNKQTGKYLVEGKGNKSELWMVADYKSYDTLAHYYIMAKDVVDPNEALTSKNEATSCSSCHRLVHTDISPEANYCPVTKGKHTIAAKPAQTLLLTEFGSGRKEERQSLENYDQLTDCINCGTIYRISGGGLNHDKDFHFLPDTPGWCPAQIGGHVPSERRYLVKPKSSNTAGTAGILSTAKCSKCSAVTDQDAAYGGCKDTEPDWGGGAGDHHNFNLHYDIALKSKNPWDQVFDPANRAPFPAFATGKQAEIFQYITKELSRNLDPGQSLREALVNKARFGVLHGDLLALESRGPSVFPGFDQDWKSVFEQIHSEMDLADRVHQYFTTLDKMITDAFLQMTWAYSENTLRLDAENKQETTEIDPVVVLLSIFGKMFTALGELPEIGTPFKAVAKGSDLISLLIDTVKKNSAKEQSWQPQDKIKLERAELVKELGSYFNSLKDQLSQQKLAILTNWGMLSQTSNIALDLDDKTVKDITDAMVASFSMHVCQIIFASRFVLIEASHKPNTPGYTGFNYWVRDASAKIHPAMLIIERQATPLDPSRTNTIWKFVVKKESVSRLSQNFFFAGQLDTSFLPSENLMQEIYRRPPIQVKDQAPVPMGTKNLFDSEAIFFGVGGWDILPVRKMWMWPGTGNEIGMDFYDR